jgi:hypothetical protein
MPRDIEKVKHLSSVGIEEACGEHLCEKEKIHTSK